MLEYYFFEVINMGTIKEAKEFLLLPNKYWASIALAGTVILIGKPIAKNFKGGSRLYDMIGIWVFVITIVAYAILLVSLLLHYWERLMLKLAIRNAIKAVNDLGEDKKIIIRKLYEKQDHVIELPIANQQVLQLAEMKVLALATSFTPVIDPSEIWWKYTLNPWVITAIESGKIKL